MVSEENKNDKSHESNNQDGRDKLPRSCLKSESKIKEIIDDVSQIQDQKHDSR